MTTRRETLVNDPDNVRVMLAFVDCNDAGRDICAALNDRMVEIARQLLPNEILLWRRDAVLRQLNAWLVAHSAFPPKRRAILIAQAGESLLTRSHLPLAFHGFSESERATIEAFVRDATRWGEIPDWRQMLRLINARRSRSEAFQWVSSGMLR